ncbi:unnamed protein product [Boreogadus saida]
MAVTAHVTLNRHMYEWAFTARGNELPVGSDKNKHYREPEMCDSLRSSDDLHRRDSILQSPASRSPETCLEMEKEDATSA